MKPRIYWNPLSSDTDEGMFENCQRAVDVGIQLMQKGHYAIPHLSLWTNIRAEVKHGVTFDWDWWMAWTWIYWNVEAIYYIGSSRGAILNSTPSKELVENILSLDEVPRRVRRHDERWCLLQSRNMTLYAVADITQHQASKNAKNTRTKNRCENPRKIWVTKSFFPGQDCADRD